MSERLRVGIVGLQPERGWAVRAHVPALRALPEDFTIVGVANSNKASAKRAASAFEIPTAFSDVSELVASPDIDVVAITVRVPYHLELAKAAIGAGKHVYCEWPLGNGLAEAEEMAALARAKNVVAVSGTQAPVSLEVEYLRKLIAEDYVGEVLSTTIVGRGGPVQGAGTIPNEKDFGYLLDRSSGATMLTIPVGHTLAAITSVLGNIAEVSGVLATRRPTALVLDSGKRLPASSPDEVLVSGTLASGAPISIHYHGGSPRDGNGFLWEIHGTRGDIRISGASGQTQMVQLSLAGARGDEKAFLPLELPQGERSRWPSDVQSRNVALVYRRMANDLRHGTRSAPSFDDGVALHRIIDAIEQAADRGVRVELHSKVSDGSRLQRTGTSVSRDVPALAGTPTS
jgi:predicted dehydrogenase